MGRARGRAAALETPTYVGDRYRVVRELGRGGMAGVYEVVDERSGGTLALKRLEPQAMVKRYEQVARLFEREFLTLARLAHPRVVAAYDYGYDGEHPFYTMELLDGGDLHALAPLPWSQACALLIDVCSALSLLHSRRLVHRDATPRNIRCTKHREAKLIDFGAMATFGPCKQVVGTPPFTAPESLAAQSLDARTDLFTLGATLYHALTGKHAYPARRFSELRDTWRTAPLPPSRLAADVPESLDRLVLSLLQVQPLARPASAAEVLEHLGAISGISLPEQLRVGQAYLSAPTLEGRSEAQLSVRKATLRARRRQGGSFLITGAAGTGRSRFLDACVLEGKLAGATVVRADAGDAGSGNFAVARALAEQLLDAHPEVARRTLRPHRGALMEVFSTRSSPSAPTDVLESCDVPVYDSPQARRGTIVSAFREWLLSLSRERYLLLAVDDVDRIDEASAALLASLAHAAQQEAVLVVAAALEHPDNERPPAVTLLEQAGGSLKLRALGHADTKRLVRSVFGDVPNVELLSDRIFAVTRGNPRDVMAAAQYLLDHGLVRYEAGAFTLPASIDTSALPSSASALVAARIEKLEARCRSLAEAIALASLDALSFDECKGLSLHESDSQLTLDLEHLLDEGLLTQAGEHYAILDPRVRRVAVEGIPFDRATDLHRRISAMFEGQRDQSFRTAMHALYAGDEERAVSWILAYAETVRESRSDSLAGFERLRDLPAQWCSVLEDLLALCERQGRRRADAFALQVCIMANGVLAGQSPSAALKAVLAQLHHDSGLDIYEALDDAIEPAQRLQRALTLAQQRFDAAPESERVNPPGAAIMSLAQCIVSTVGVSARSYDYELLASAPDLTPLIGLSPALELVHLNRCASQHFLAARLDEAGTLYREILARMDAQDRAGLEERAHLYMRLAMQYALGIFEINVGIPTGVRWADCLDDNPSFVVNAHRLRMLHALRQGDWEAAKRHRAQLELMRIQNCPPQIFEGTHLFAELLAFIAAEDLVRVKQTLPQLEAVAREVPTCEPCAGLGRGAYHLLRGDPRSAREELERAREGLWAGRHVAWPALTHNWLLSLVRLGLVDEAIERGRRALQEATEARLGSLLHYIRQPLALALAQRGEFEEAVEFADAAIASFEEKGSTGVPLGEAYETRARVALLMGDAQNFSRCCTLCAEQYRAGHNPVLTAKYQRLLQEAQHRRLDLSDETADAARFGAQSDAALLSRVSTLLGGCKGAEERAQETLRNVIRECRSTGGLLFTVQAGGAALSAQAGDLTSTPELDAAAREYIAAELAEEEETAAMTQTGTLAALPAHWVDGDGQALAPMLLCHPHAGGFVITGVVALRPSPEGFPPNLTPLLRALSRALFEAGDVVTAAVT